jgi:hypothetical protein
MRSDRSIDELSTALRIAVYNALDNVRTSPSTPPTMLPVVAQLLAVDGAAKLLYQNPTSTPKQS